MTLRPPAALVIALSVALAGCARGHESEPPTASAAPVAPPSMAADDLVLLADLVSETSAPPTAPPTTAPTTTTTVDVRSDGRPGHLDPDPRDPEPAVDPISVRAPDPGPSPAALSSPPPTTVPAPSAPPPTTTQAPAPTTTEAPPPTTTQAPAPADPGAGSQFVSQINALRASVGVGALSRNGELDALARSWTEYMAGSGDFRHSSIISDLVAGGWSIAGENIGYGPSVDSVYAALQASPSHYDNMVEARFTSVGIGVVVDGAGVLWTTHLFAG